MVNYSLVSRSVNANLLEINLAKARIKAVKEGKGTVEFTSPNGGAKE